MPDLAFVPTLTPSFSQYHRPDKVPHGLVKQSTGRLALSSTLPLDEHTPLHSSEPVPFAMQSVEDSSSKSEITTA